MPIPDHMELALTALESAGWRTALDAAHETGVPAAELVRMLEAGDVPHLSIRPDSFGPAPEVPSEIIMIRPEHVAEAPRRPALVEVTA